MAFGTAVLPVPFTVVKDAGCRTSGVLLVAFLSSLVLKEPNKYMLAPPAMKRG